MKKLIGVSLVFFFCLPSWSVSANNQNPDLHWGYTDYMDAAIPGPGFIFNPKSIFYNASSPKDGDGKPLPGTNKLSLTAFSPQFVYIGKTEPQGNLKWGAQVMGPVVSLNADSSLGLGASNSILGDLCLSQVPDHLKRALVDNPKPEACGEAPAMPVFS